MLWRHELHCGRQTVEFGSISTLKRAPDKPDVPVLNSPGSALWATELLTDIILRGIRRSFVYPAGCGPDEGRSICQKLLDDPTGKPCSAAAQRSGSIGIVITAFMYHQRVAFQVVK